MNVVGQRRRIFFLWCSLKIYTALSSILRDYFVVAKCTVDPPTNAAIDLIRRLHGDACGDIKESRNLHTRE